MATFSRVALSASLNGLPIPITTIASPGQVLHTTVTGGMDELYLWAANVTANAATLTLEWGSSATLFTTLVIPPNSPSLPIVCGQMLSNGLSLRAFSGTASAINLVGHANRIQ